MLNTDERKVVQNAVDALTGWMEKDFKNSDGYTPMWNPTLRTLRNLLTEEQEASTPQPDYDALYRAIVHQGNRAGLWKTFAQEVIKELASALPCTCKGYETDISCPLHGEPASCERPASECPAAQPEPEAAHDYTSTACQHGFHERCRKNCKFCQVPCKCDCHKHPAPSRHDRTIEDEARIPHDAPVTVNYKEPCKLPCTRWVYKGDGIHPECDECGTLMPTPPAAPRLPLESEVVQEMTHVGLTAWSAGERSWNAIMTGALRAAEKWLLNRPSPAPEGRERVTDEELEKLFQEWGLSSGVVTNFEKGMPLPISGARLYSREANIAWQAFRYAFASAELRAELAAKEEGK